MRLTHEGFNQLNVKEFVGLLEPNNSTGAQVRGNIMRYGSHLRSLGLAVSGLKMSTMKFTNRICALALVGLILLFAGCKRNGNNVATPPTESSPSQSKSEPTPRSAFERDMQYVRNSQFTYVWVFSRKDGKPLDKDDAAYLRTTAPQVVDWVTTDEGKKVIGGTNFDLEQGNLSLLKKRFVVEDYSRK
ncbi:MAG: hypothetical protein JWM21_515 [Acidobacteria bacterium]|nr:hypothetical protein [Acidobacteriota bacterium]